MAKVAKAEDVEARSDPAQKPKEAASANPRMKRGNAVSLDQKLKRGNAGELGKGKSTTLLPVAPSPRRISDRSEEERSIERRVSGSFSNAPQTQEDSREVRKFRVTICSARDVVSSRSGTVFAPLCVCEVKGKPKSRIATDDVDKTELPQWNHKAVLECNMDDSVVFTIFDREPGSPLARGTLTALEFWSFGYDGDLALKEGGRCPRAILNVKFEQEPETPRARPSRGSLPNKRASSAQRPGQQEISKANTSVFGERRDYLLVREIYLRWKNNKEVFEVYDFNAPEDSGETADGENALQASTTASNRDACMERIWKLAAPRVHAPVVEEEYIHKWWHPGATERRQNKKVLVFHAPPRNLSSGRKFMKAEISKRPMQRPSLHTNGTTRSAPHVCKVDQVLCIPDNVNIRPEHWDPPSSGPPGGWSKITEPVGGRQSPRSNPEVGTYHQNSLAGGGWHKAKKYPDSIVGDRSHLAFPAEHLPSCKVTDPGRQASCGWAAAAKERSQRGQYDATLKVGLPGSPSSFAAVSSPAGQSSAACAVCPASTFSAPVGK